MIIGLGSNNLQTYLGGVQTWTRTVSDAIRKLGYECKTYDINAPNIPGADIYIIAHNTILKKHIKQGVPATLIVHGVIPKLERPVYGASRYFAVSEETQQFTDKLGFNCTRIVRNPIDTDRFGFVGCRKRPEKVVINNYRRTLPFIDDLKKRFDVYELNASNQTDDVKSIIKDADIVIATGRAAYEAMAMGKNVIISGEGNYRGGEYLDGLVDNDSYLKFRRFNCSGRYLMRKVVSWKDFDVEIQKYDESQGFRNSLLIKNDHDYIKVTRELILNAR